MRNDTLVGMTEAIERRMTQALARVFEDEGLAVEAQGVARAVLAAAASSATPLTAGEVTFLDAHSGIEADETPDSAVVAAALASGIDDAVWDTTEIAARLGVSRPTVTRRRAAGDLLAIEVGGRLLFPTWQVVDGVLVPGLKEAMAGVPEAWSLHRLERFMTTPDESLDSFSPVEWLRHGGAPAEIAALVEAESWE